MKMRDLIPDVSKICDNLKTLNAEEIDGKISYPPYNYVFKWSLYSAFIKCYPGQMNMHSRIYKRLIAAMPPDRRSTKCMYVMDYMGHIDTTAKDIIQLVKDADV